jgi:pimeloyl-ACP methyl ester carboxylesterase
MMRPILNDVREKRDIVMIDQRGTGSSAPLDCPVPDDEDMDLENELDPERIAEMTRECLAGLEGDPALYTTAIGMRDYDLVREAMGYEQINLLGISYGTRSSQIYLRMFPERVRSVILDSVVPMQLNLGAEHSMMLDRAMEKVLADCAEDEVCGERFPVAMDDLRGLVRSLRETPREIEFTHPLTGETDSLVVTGDLLAVALRFLNYSSATQAVLPLLTHEALTTGRLDRLASQAMLVMGGLAETLSRGMELSVLCSEDHPFMGPPPDEADTLLGGVMRQVMDVQCELWPKGEVADDFHEPVRWDGPVLLMSGERDPVTPPAYAAQAAETFPRSANLVAPGLGHMVIKHRCLRAIAADFIAEPDVSRLETECIDAIEPSPFFTTLLGPEP